MTTPDPSAGVNGNPGEAIFAAEDRPKPDLPPRAVRHAAPALTHHERTTR